MRMIGTSAYGIRFPIISQGDDLVQIAADTLMQVCEKNSIKLTNKSILGITEAVVAKAQGNFATVYDIKESVLSNFHGEEIAVVFPILSRNRFAQILKGISLATTKVHLLLQYPYDEVGNPILDINRFDEIDEKLDKAIYSQEEFEAVAGKFLHPFTDLDYPELYKNVNSNIDIYFSKNPMPILDYCKNVIVADVHSRFMTQKRLEKAGAKKVICLHDILSESIGNSGYNPEYGILGSNMSTEDTLKLFPRNCNEFVREVQTKVYELSGVQIEVLVYGDGAFKDSEYGIWELDDPVVSPGYTDGLSGYPNEIKLKFIADNNLSDLNQVEKLHEIKKLIAAKNSSDSFSSVGTTPRKYTDLIGSLCDLMSGSGDKGTPVVLIQGYFDDFSNQ